MATLKPLLLSCALMFFAHQAQASGQSPSYAHSLDASFDPAAKRLQVTDTLTVSEGAPARLSVTLSPRAKGLVITANRKPVRFSRSGEAIAITLPPATSIIAIRYALPLDPPPASLPPTQDNPGTLASDAACGPDWAMLMPGSLWHPEMPGVANAFEISIASPSGIKAVTQGALKGFSERDGRTVSAWSVPRPTGRLGLCLARYDVQETRDGPVPVQTFFLENSRQLAPTYLAASAKHVAFYQNLHGLYAFEKFAVVENPLPTGYGLPSYTLLGSQVLALPFIPETSLRHEIAHSWWGNGVPVDYSRGNWCEGLTTYVADYLARAEESAKAAREYRLKTLRAYADLVRHGKDLPLARFDSRVSSATQAVGYGKALFVFHMLRGFVGDDAFWQGLRRIYAERLFKPTSWEDFRKIYAGSDGFDEAASKRFFAQWTSRTGGPKLNIAKASAAPNPSGGYTIRGELAQEGEPYLLKLTLQADSPGGSATRQMILDSPGKEFSLDVPGKPTRLMIDPGADCFRLLEPEEIPPSVNTVKGAKKLTVILADSAPESLRLALPQLLAGLDHEKTVIIKERDATADKLRSLAAEGILVAGTPGVDIPGYRDMLGQAPQADTVFAVLPRKDAFTAVFQARPDAIPQAVTAAAAKMTHYGSFSLLGFKESRNVLKEGMEPAASPLVWEFGE